MRRLKLVILVAGLALSLRGERVESTASRLEGSPEPPPPFRLVPAFPGIAFKEPVFIAQEPGGTVTWFWGKRRGLALNCSAKTR